MSPASYRLSDSTTRFMKVIMKRFNQNSNSGDLQMKSFMDKDFTEI